MSTRPNRLKCPREDILPKQGESLKWGFLPLDLTLNRLNDPYVITLFNEEEMLIKLHRLDYDQITWMKPTQSWF